MRRRTAAERRLPIPPGWTSKGEVIRVGPDGKRPRYPAIVGGTTIMAKDTKDPGAEVVARGADVPLALAENAGPRDALVDFNPDVDYVPDMEAKGYHVGTVRQPAEPVLTAGGDVHFESTDDAGESKFVGASGDLRSLKDFHNQREADDDRYAGVAPSRMSVSNPYGDETVERQTRSTRRATRTTWRPRSIGWRSTRRCARCMARTAASASKTILAGRRSRSGRWSCIGHS